MSYEKAMKHARNVKKCRKQGNMYFGFSSLADNERRSSPILGGVWYEPGMDEKRAARIAEWKAETEEMLKRNPNLKIVD